ncbi:hypothetical protein SCLCIDRAFT_1207356 [Scleroderma citrinum Foug A]|uniref:Uncharacterized protein n=1 Tax=Scleroderma citrinum Foug A TaxID=1036808 RepID=A0A0C3AYK3_9AGAM|nr:hypothetical protein SCLCIDRAFT_1207356 [Scleroderma citrinum Foug A]
MYGRSKKILALLLFFFVAEVASIAAAVWRAIGPNSSFHVTLQGSLFSDVQYCMFAGITGSFTFLFIPVVCFETLLFVLAAKIFFENIRNRRMSGIQGEGGAFMKVLARDSLFYFAANLVMCAVIMGLWESVAARYVNICVPLVMLFEVIVGTRLVINFRERFNRPDRAAVVSGRHSALARNGVRRNSLRVTVSYEIETLVDGEKPEGVNVC